MYNRIEPSKTWSLLGCSALLLAGCLDQNGGMVDTTNVQLTTGTVGSSGGEDDTSTTFPPIMTTTHDPGSGTSASSSDASTGTTGEPIPPECGDGEIQADQGEQCDNGPDNADEAECTLHCQLAKCGDGLVLKGTELCDDGENNGQYDACNVSCSGPGPRCGDGVIQADEGELCDSSDPKSGCLKDTCQWAKSCLELKNAWGEAAASDSGYKILRNDQNLSVYCDMDTDGGGYTFLKFSNSGGVEVPAMDAETTCSQYEMHLFVPRTAEHLKSAVQVAENHGFGPVGGGPDGNVTTYLRIMGIYPKTEGESCPGKPFNLASCPEWEAHDHQRYWVTGMKMSDTQPSTDNCVGCSMYFTWDALVDPPVLKKIEAGYLGGFGHKSPAFLCDPADKT